MNSLQIRKPDFMYFPKYYFDAKHHKQFLKIKTPYMTFTILLYPIKVYLYRKVFFHNHKKMLLKLGMFL